MLSMICFRLRFVILDWSLCGVTQGMVYNDESPHALEKKPSRAVGWSALEMLSGPSWLFRSSDILHAPSPRSFRDAESA